MENKTPENKNIENKAVEQQKLPTKPNEEKTSNISEKGKEKGKEDTKETNTKIAGIDLSGINIEKFKEWLEIGKKYILIIKDFFSNKEHERTVIVSLTIISIIGLGYSIFHIITQIGALEKETNNLDKLDKYTIETLRGNQLTSNLTNNASIIKDLIDINENISNEITRFDGHKKELQSSYSNFFQYFLVPNLNIWKEPYTDKINLNIIGEEFLGNNPFNEINLYQKRSNFFSNTEKNQINQIKNLQIGEINESDFGLYSIKISFDFSTPSKNALLFLADKISMTSDKENIALLGEFIYYLWQQIKTDKSEIIAKLKMDDDNKDLGGIEDKIIGKNIYQWVTSDKTTELIDEKIINKTVKNIMGCGNENDNICFYKFRDKYRNIAELAYTVGATNNTNKIEDLKSFFKTMPPLIAVTNFNFNKIIEEGIINKSISYQGTVALEIYGQNIKIEDIQQIARELGKKCFSSDIELNPGLAISKINESSTRNDENDFDDNGKADLNAILENIASSYETASNYKKTIRLFEIYRMLSEAGYCTAI